MYSMFNCMLTYRHLTLHWQVRSCLLSWLCNKIFLSHLGILMMTIFKIGNYTSDVVFVLSCISPDRLWVGVIHCPLGHWICGQFSVISHLFCGQAANNCFTYSMILLYFTVFSYFIILVCPLNRGSACIMCCQNVHFSTSRLTPYIC